MLQCRTGEALQNFISRCSFLRCQLAKNGIQKLFGHVIRIAICRLYFAVRIIRVDTKGNVTRQGPRGGGPGKEPGILSYNLEADNSGALFHRFIALSNFLGGKRRSTARTIRYNFKSFIKTVFVPDFFQRPPLGFNKIVIIGDIGIIHVCPETNSIRKVFPHSFVFPDRFLTLLDEWLHTIFFNLLFAVQPKQFLHFQLHWQSMGIPSGLTGYFVPFHGTVTGNHILDNTGQHMTDMRLSVGRRRSIIEHIGRSIFPQLNALSENILVFPELFYLFLSLDKIHAC